MTFPFNLWALTMWIFPQPIMFTGIFHTTGLLHVLVPLSRLFSPPPPSPNSHLSVLLVLAPALLLQQSLAHWSNPHLWTVVLVPVAITVLYLSPPLVVSSTRAWNPMMALFTVSPAPSKAPGTQLTINRCLNAQVFSNAGHVNSPQGGVGAGGGCQKEHLKC